MLNLSLINVMKIKLYLAKPDIDERLFVKVGITIYIFQLSSWLLTLKQILLLVVLEKDQIEYWITTNSKYFYFLHQYIHPFMLKITGRSWSCCVFCLCVIGYNYRGTSIFTFMLQFKLNCVPPIVEMVEIYINIF